MELCSLLDFYAIQEKREKIKSSKDLLCWHEYSSTIPPQVCLMAPKLFLVPMDAKYVKQSKYHKQGKHEPVSNWFISEPSVFLPAAVQQSRFHHVPRRLLLCFLKNMPLLLLTRWTCHTVRLVII
jgi:hypothetical protein